jgi:hypothetical protein
MGLLTLKNPFAVRAAASKVSMASNSQSYRMTVIAQSPALETPALERIFDLLLFELAPIGVMPQHIRHEGEDAGRFVKIVANVICTPAQRTVLVHFVNRAGMLRGVRSVRWENVPQADPVVFHWSRSAKLIESIH